MPIDDATPHPAQDHPAQDHPAQDHQGAERPASPWPFYGQSPVIVWGLGLATAAILGYGIFWLWLAAGLVRSIDGWIAAQAPSGVRAAYASVKLGGFPFRVGARLDAPRIESPMGQWQGDSLLVSFAPFADDRVRLVLHGADHVRVGRRAWDVTSSFIRTDLGFDTGGTARRLRTFQVTAGDVTVAGDDGLAAEIEGFGLSVLPVDHHDDADYKTPWASFVVTMAGVRAGTGPESQDRPPVALVEASGRVMGALRLDDPVTALARWSRSGGVLQFDRFVADWPPVAIQGQGTLALDGNLQPLASFSTEFRGMGQFADGLERSGAIDPSGASQLRSVFADTAKTDGKGRTVLAVPLTVQDGKLWAGPVAVAPMPEIRWP